MIGINHEEHLIGSLLNRPDLLPDAQALVTGSDFDSTALSLAFDWLADAKLKGDGGNHDRMAFLAWVRKDKIRFDGPEAGDPGGQETIARRIIEISHGTFTELHAKCIANAATLRRLARLTGVVSETIRDRDANRVDDGAECLQRVSELVADIQTKSARGEAVEIKTALADVLKEIESRQYGHSRIGLETGFTTLDRMLSGFRPGELIVLAARPGVGKSALAGNIAANICDKIGGRVLFASLEMTQGELCERMLSSASGVDHALMRAGNLTAKHRATIVETAVRLSQWQLRIDDRHGQRVADIVAQARRMQMRGGLDLVVIDYLQLMAPDNPRDPRQEQVARMSRGLKGAAKSLKVPILCLAQLNRQADTPNDPPRLSHLRESGAIEQDADVVLFIHRTEEEKAKANRNGKPPEAAGKDENSEASLIISKQRNGPTGPIKLEWMPGVVTFSEHSAARFDCLPRTVDIPHELDNPDRDTDEFYDPTF